MKKILGIVLFVVIGFGIFPSHGSAQTVGELQTMINTLLQEIQKLQAQLAATQQTGGQWCYTFNNNLGVGSTGNATRNDNTGENDIKALQTALQKEGFSLGNSGDIKTGYFGEDTASAVVGFQEKYKSEILTPSGLNHGTGYVGKATRSKLNKLYGCGATRTNPQTNNTIALISPNGGEQWTVGTVGTGGNGVSIKWTPDPYSRYVEAYLEKKQNDQFIVIGKVVPSGYGSIEWDGNIDRAPWSAPAGDGYYIRLVNTQTGATDRSDAPFTILTPGTAIGCKDEQGGKPVITSLSSNSGPVGTKLEIKGCNLSGFEGDKNLVIKNSQGVGGILYGESGSTSNLIKVTLNSPLCQGDNSYSGLPCNAWLTLTPGTYKIYTRPWSENSNEVNFTITSVPMSVVSVYFGKISDSNTLNCSVTSPVSRSIPQTLAVARASLEQLLQGPTMFESQAGFRTFLGAGININSLTITNGVAYVDFSALSDPSGSGACGVAKIVSQITNTLKQFPTITSVKMTVNGEDASIILERMAAAVG
ncbi:MAG: GerMN domain-containing protein [Candidatus Paceibacterota bacterium]|jgi:peptidoglycan hydrolase-like protein with peptidoglycan-binding domain